MFVIPYNATVKTQNTKQDKHKKIARLFVRTHQILCSSASLQIKRNQFLKQFPYFPFPFPRLSGPGILHLPCHGHCRRQCRRAREAAAAVRRIPRNFAVRALRAVNHSPVCNVKPRSFNPYAAYLLDVYPNSKITQPVARLLIVPCTM